MSPLCFNRQMKPSRLALLAAVLLAGCAAQGEKSAAVECRNEAHVMRVPNNPMPYGTQSESASGVTAADVRSVRETDEFQKCMQRKGAAPR